MSSNPVDKVFDACYTWYCTAARKSGQLVDNIKELTSFTTTEPIVPPQEHVLPLTEQIYGQRYKVLSILGISASALLLWKFLPHVIPRTPAHLKQCDQCVLILGHMRDPITRHIVMDLYRRGFIVVVCSENCSDQNDDEGLFHIEYEELNKLTELLISNSLTLKSILIIPNSAYYPSGLFTNLSNKNTRIELEQNVFKHYHALTKLLPHFNSKIQIILFSPSLSQNFSVPHHSPEILVSGLISSLYKIIKTEYSNHDTYLCHLGVLQIAGNPSNYKYLSSNGSNINRSLLEPLFRLILSKSFWWLAIFEWFRGHQRFYGKGSMLGYYLGNWLPLRILRMV